MSTMHSLPLEALWGTDQLTRFAGMRSCPASIRLTFPVDQPISSPSTSSAGGYVRVWHEREVLESSWHVPVAEGELTKTLTFLAPPVMTPLLTSPPIAGRPCCPLVAVTCSREDTGR
jgi:hypothetical protein